MPGDVTPLHGVPTGQIDSVSASGPVNPEVVAQLRKLLSMAEDGRLVGFAIAMQFADGKPMIGHAPNGDTSASTAEMIGLVSCLQHHLLEMTVTRSRGG